MSNEEVRYEDSELRTFLKELEPVRDASLIAGKEESPTTLGLRSLLLFFREFRAELHTTAHNAILLNRNGSNRGWQGFQIVTWVGLPDVCGKRAAEL